MANDNEKGPASNPLDMPPMQLKLQLKKKK